MDRSLDIAALCSAYAAGTDPSEVIDALHARIMRDTTKSVWITIADIDATHARIDKIKRRRAAGETLPLYGIPFAVKDNIDVAGMPTTAACPAFGYTPSRTAPVIDRLLDAGAVLIGKTNLDQFATGLVGTRSPYGVPRNPFDARYIPGGSSSGSAVAVAAGLVSFALGTDTAGSGRVPTAFNNVVGLKPTRGLLSTRAAVPACRSLDCVSIFALTPRDTSAVLDVVACFDPDDELARKAQSMETSSFGL